MSFFFYNSLLFSLDHILDSLTECNIHVEETREGCDLPCQFQVNVGYGLQWFFYKIVTWATSQASLVPYIAYQHHFDGLSLIQLRA